MPGGVSDSHRSRYSAAVARLDVGEGRVRALRVMVVGGELPYLLRFREPLIRALVESGNEVLVATPDVEPEPSRLSAIGASYQRVPFRPTGMNPIRDLRDFSTMMNVQGTWRPDLVFAYGAKASIIALSVAARLGIRRRYAMLPGLGFAFVDDGQRSLRRALARWAQLVLFRLVLRPCRCVIFHNDDDRRELLARGAVRDAHTAVVHGSGVDLERFHATPVPTEPVRFLFIGRILRSKGVEELVLAARTLRDSVPTAEVHLVGATDANPDHVDVAALEAAVSRGDVIWHGHASDVRPHLEACSAFVLPSYREGLPRSALEAMACGRTTIVTDVPGCREIVREGAHGALVPVRDAAALARTMIEYARSPQRMIVEGRAARTTAEREFDVRSVTDEMLQLLELGNLSR